MRLSRSSNLTLPHQTEGTQFLRERTAAALFDEQGLGKSKQLIDAVVASIQDGSLAGALIVCPNTIKATWGEEIERHSEERYAIFGSGKKARRVAFRSLRASFYVINYEAIAAELPSLGRSCDSRNGVRPRRESPNQDACSQRDSCDSLPSSGRRTTVHHDRHSRRQQTRGSLGAGVFPR